MNLVIVLLVLGLLVLAAGALLLEGRYLSDLLEHDDEEDEDDAA